MKTTRRLIVRRVRNGMVASVLLGVAFVPGLYSLFRWNKKQEKGL